MLTYENIESVNFIALQTADYTCDNNEILSRLYENNVEINYTIDDKNNSIHILYIEAYSQKQGHGTNTLREFLNEYSTYDIEVEALFYLKSWYEKFDFKFQYSIDEMFCYNMKLERKH